MSLLQQSLRAFAAGMAVCCSVYAAVNGSVAAAAALVDRERSGQGREIVASRLGSGLSAIGALALTSKGLPEHFSPIVIGGIPEGMSAEQFKTFAAGRVG